MTTNLLHSRSTIRIAVPKGILIAVINNRDAFSLASKSNLLNRSQFRLKEASSGNTSATGTPAAINATSSASATRLTSTTSRGQYQSPTLRAAASPNTGSSRG